MNLLEQAINTDDSDQGAKIIRDALGIVSDDVANYCFPKTWPADREVSGVMMHITPFFQFALAMVIPGDWVILLAALLIGRT